MFAARRSCTSVASPERPVEILPRVIGCDAEVGRRAMIAGEIVEQLAALLAVKAPRDEPSDDVL